MTIVLTPYWSNGVQKLKAAPAPPPKPAHGLTPTMLDDRVHLQRCLLQLRSKDKAIEKNIFLSQLKHADEHMFYRLLLANMPEITPIIYTPTVGDACLQYSANYRRPEGMFISIKDKGRIGQVLKSWPRPAAGARIAVVTDGSRILGLGDLGVNGMPISIGKLSLYVAAAGIRPETTVPICLDLGTNNQKFLDDPLYLGLRHKRIANDVMDAFMEEFMFEMKRTFPDLLLQFEDFSTDHAFHYLEAFRNRDSVNCVFNDDIQGTGSVVLGGFINAAKLSSAASNRPLTDHRILFIGSGSAGVGVAMQLQSFFTLAGLSEKEARERIYLVDSQGLVYDARGELAEHKRYFSRKDYFGSPITELTNIIEYVKPTALLGLSTIGGMFTKEVIQLMAALNPRPIIFPLSNPVRLSECTFEDAMVHSNGRAIFASGSPFDPIGSREPHGQANNFLVFPGIGLGAILAKAAHVTDSMIEACSLGLAKSLTPDERAADLIYPRLMRVREVTADIAVSVIRAAQKAGVDRNVALCSMDDNHLHTWVESKMWSPA